MGGAPCISKLYLGDTPFSEAESFFAIKQVTVQRNQLQNRCRPLPISLTLSSLRPEILCIQQVRMFRSGKRLVKDPLLGRQEKTIRTLRQNLGVIFPSVCHSERFCNFPCTWRRLCPVVLKDSLVCPTNTKYSQKHQRHYAIKSSVVQLVLG